MLRHHLPKTQLSSKQWCLTAPTWIASKRAIEFPFPNSLLHWLSTILLTFTSFKENDVYAAAAAAAAAAEEEEEEEEEEEQQQQQQQQQHFGHLAVWPVLSRCF